jgi:5-methyltetrahydropteroyltriglutamate--homocysteine methyltransferase
VKRSTDGILTTHTGSLPRPDRLEQIMFAKLEHEEFDEDELAAEIRAAVREAVRKQVDAGIRVVGDGEMSREGMQYVRDHMHGFGEESVSRAGFQDLLDHPQAMQRMFVGAAGLRHIQRPACIGPIEYKDLDWLERDFRNLREALAGVDYDEAFVTVTSPGTVAQILDENRHYETREAYITALADAVKVQCDAIVEAGFLVQIDACDLPMEFHTHFSDLPTKEAHAQLEVNVEAINRAVADVPADRLRLHVCWGNYPGPHHRDVPMSEILDLVLSCKAGAISFPAANPRHEHEWRAWEDVDLDGRVLIPGVIDTVAPIVEHPRVVADRLQRFADVVGAENVIASTDCGFGTFVGSSPVAPSVAYAKLEALAEGARLASADVF